MKKTLLLINLLLLFFTNVQAQNKSNFEQNNSQLIKQHPPKSRILNEASTSIFVSKDGKIKLEYKIQVSQENEEETQEEYEKNPDRNTNDGFYGDGSEITQYLQGIIKINDVTYLVYGQYLAEGNFEAVVYDKNKKLYAIADWILDGNNIIFNLKTEYKVWKLILFFH